MQQFESDRAIYYVLKQQTRIPHTITHGPVNEQRKNAIKQTKPQLGWLLHTLLAFWFRRMVNWMHYELWIELVRDCLRPWWGHIMVGAVLVLSNWYLKMPWRLRVVPGLGSHACHLHRTPGTTPPDKIDVTLYNSTYLIMLVWCLPDRIAVVWVSLPTSPPIHDGAHSCMTCEPQPHA